MATEDYRIPYCGHAKFCELIFCWTLGCILFVTITNTTPIVILAPRALHPPLLWGGFMDVELLGEACAFC